NLDRQPSKQQGHTRYVTVILASLVSTTQDNIFNITYINICSPYRFSNRQCSKIIRAYIFQTSGITPNGSAYRRDDNRFFHYLAYLPLNSAFRFSIKARIPSRISSVAKSRKKFLRSISSP